MTSICRKNILWLLSLQVGKLDPRQIFGSEDKENVMEREQVKVGRLDPAAIFQARRMAAEQEEAEEGEEKVRIGKLNLDGLVFEGGKGAEQAGRPERRVGKLKVEVGFSQVLASTGVSTV